MSLPRNPRYFPKMKVRGARRRRLATFQRIAGSFDRLQGEAITAATAIQRLNEIVIRHSTHLPPIKPLMPKEAL